MWHELREYWVPLALFAATLLVAVGLALTVLVAPMVPIAHEVIGLFAQDATVRRTSLASAVGLTVTAFVFFRPNASVLTKAEPKIPGQNTVAGA